VGYSCHTGGNLCFSGSFLWSLSSSAIDWYRQAVHMAPFDLVFTARASKRRSELMNGGDTVLRRVDPASSLVAINSIMIG